jgi:hypothetical protein
LHFGDGFPRLTRVDCSHQWMVAALAPDFSWDASGTTIADQGLEIAKWRKLQ